MEVTRHAEVPVVEPCSGKPRAFFDAQQTGSQLFACSGIEPGSTSSMRSLRKGNMRRDQLHKLSQSHDAAPLDPTALRELGKRVLPGKAFIGLPSRRAPASHQTAMLSSASGDDVPEPCQCAPTDRRAPKLCIRARPRTAISRPAMFSMWCNEPWEVLGLHGGMTQEDRFSVDALVILCRAPCPCSPPAVFLDGLLQGVPCIQSL